MWLIVVIAIASFAGLVCVCYGAYACCCRRTKRLIQTPPPLETAAQQYPRGGGDGRILEQ